MARKLLPIGTLVDVLSFDDPKKVDGRGPIVAHGRPENGFTYAVAAPGNMQWCRPRHLVRAVRPATPKRTPRGFWVEINPYARMLGGLGWRRHQFFTARKEANRLRDELLAAFGRGYAKTVPEY